MTTREQLEELIQNLRTVSNKQVELFDRLRHVEERVDAFLERVRKCEDRTLNLEKTVAQKPARL
jgi:hypothetical protein